MAWLFRGMWRYGVLIMLLFVLAAFASMKTIGAIESFLMSRAGGMSPESLHDALRIVTLPILSLTMGFLFLSGALGVWAIRSTAQIESRRRLGRFVDAMGYMSDGLVIVDRRGRITGSNPMARSLAGRELRLRGGLADLFPSLSDEQVKALTDTEGPREIECAVRHDEGVRALRLRSQPSEDVSLILISDITGLKSEEIHRRQAARMQLIGRLARGVAHDFNNILCAVSGHASLLGRGGLTPEQAEGRQAILREAQRGAALAAQVLGLSRTGERGRPCERLAEPVTRAAELLGVGLSRQWNVTVDLQGDFGPTAVTDEQVEQLVLNLGMLAADEAGTPGVLHIRGRPPALGGERNETDPRYAARLWIGAAPEVEPPPEGEERASPAPAETGVVESVVRSILDEAGGSLRVLPGARGRTYRLDLPVRPGPAQGLLPADILPQDVRERLLSWNVLLACEKSPERKTWEQWLRQLGVRFAVAEDVVGALQHVEVERELSVLVVRADLLGAESAALLRAIRKLRPSTGLVVLSAGTAGAPAEVDAEALNETWPAPEALLQAMLSSVRRLDPARLG